MWPGPDVAACACLWSCGQKYAKKQNLTLATCPCNEHVDCPRLYEFNGEVERSYKLTIPKSGECGGDLKKARRPPAERENAAKVHINELFDKDGVATPKNCQT